jgi:hypothetical protein
VKKPGLAFLLRTIAPEMTWVVLLGGGGRIVGLGFQPANITIQSYGNAVHPERASPRGIRGQIQFLYSKRPKK